MIKTLFSSKKTIYLWFLAGVFGLIVFGLGYDVVFPSASVDIQISRSEVLEKSKQILSSLAYNAKDFDVTVSFAARKLSSIYLQKELGIEESNKYVRDGIPIWLWKVRFYKELDKEAYVLGIDPANGRLLHFFHSLEETAAGSNVSQDEAYLKAVEFMTAQGFDLKDYDLKDKSSKTLDNRTDHAFDFEEKGFKISQATMRLHISLQGDKLGGYSYYLKVPENFSRDLQKESSTGVVLGKLTHLLMMVLLIAAIVYLLVEIKVAVVNWRAGILFVVVIVVLHFLSYFNSLPLIWNAYPPTVSKAVFLMMSIENFFGAMLGDSLMIFAFFTLGLIYARGMHINHIGRHWLRESVRAFSIAGIFLGYVTIFYYAAIKYFDIWMPIDSSYSNVLGTYLPWIAPIVFALTAALHEEVMYRLLACSFLKKVFKRKYLALLVPALLWGFAHSSYQIYPMYVRGIELTIFGVFMAWTYMRYGLATVVVAHFIINSFLASFPLLRCGDMQTVISAVLVVLLSPILFLLFVDRSNEERTS